MDKYDPEYQAEFKRLEEEARVQKLKDQAARDFAAKEKAEAKEDRKRNRAERRKKKDISHLFWGVIFFSLFNALAVFIFLWGLFGTSSLFNWGGGAAPYIAICSGPTYFIFWTTMKSVHRQLVWAKIQPEEMLELHKESKRFQELGIPLESSDLYRSIRTNIRSRYKSASFRICITLGIGLLLILAYTALLVVTDPGWGEFRGG